MNPDNKTSTVVRAILSVLIRRAKVCTFLSRHSSVYHRISDAGDRDTTESLRFLLVIERQIQAPLVSAALLTLGLTAQQVHPWRTFCCDGAKKNSGLVVVVS